MNISISNRTSFLAAISIAVLVLFISSFAFADTLTRELQIGMSGDDVSSLQAFLARDKTIYPQGLVTGYFGSLTKSAVSNFQSRNGIATVGRVGPVTLAAINLQMSGTGNSNDTSAPLIMSITMTSSATSMNVTWTTNEEASSALFYDLAPIALSEGHVGGSNSVTVSGTPVGSTSGGLRTSHNVNVPNLQPNTTYYYVIQATDQAGNSNVTWPATFKTQ